MEAARTPRWDKAEGSSIRRHPITGAWAKEMPPDLAMRRSTVLTRVSALDWSRPEATRAPSFSENVPMMLPVGAVGLMVALQCDVAACTNFETTQRLGTHQLLMHAVYATAVDRIREMLL